MVACAEAAPSRAHVSFQGSSFGKWRGGGQSRAGTKEDVYWTSCICTYLPIFNSNISTSYHALTKIFIPGNGYRYNTMPTYLHIASPGDMHRSRLRTVTTTATVLIIRDDSNPEEKNKHHQFSIIKSRPAFSEPRLSSSSRRPLTSIDGSSWDQSFLSGSCSKGPGLT